MDRVLLVDDDAGLCDLLVEYLGTEGFDVTVVHDGLSAIPKALGGDFSLVVLDVMLPGKGGLDVLKDLRRESSVPVLMLTARGDDVDRILGLELGADDYLPKPFNPRELVARIQAVLRRRTAVVPGAPTTENKVIAFGNVEVNLATRTLTRNGEPQSLTTGEFAVLKVLLEHPRQPLSRDRLMTLARGREQGPFDRAIDVQVSRLRKLVEPDPATPRYLQTVWGFGYVFIPDGETK